MIEVELPPIDSILELEIDLSPGKTKIVDISPKTLIEMKLWS